MPLPFTREEFLDGFARFNTAVWPLHLVMLALALATVVLAFRGGRRASRAVSFGLAALWVVAAMLQASFRSFMPSALPFAAVFLLQAGLFVAAGARDRLAFHAPRGGLPELGLFLVAFAGFLYPALGTLTGHTWPHMPLLGVAPCPNTIFTFGLLLFTEQRVPRWLLPIPFLWSLVGIFAAAFLGVKQDWALPAAGILGTAALVLRDRVHHVPRHA